MESLQVPNPDDLGEMIEFVPKFLVLTKADLEAIIRANDEALDASTDLEDYFYGHLGLEDLKVERVVPKILTTSVDLSEVDTRDLLDLYDDFYHACIHILEGSTVQANGLQNLLIKAYQHYLPLLEARSDFEYYVHKLRNDLERLKSKPGIQYYYDYLRDITLNKR